MAEWIGVREMERRREVSRGSVRIAVLAGRIPEACIRRGTNGSIEAIEYEAATAAWNVNTDVDQAARNIGGAATVAACDSPQRLVRSRAADADTDPHRATLVRVLALARVDFLEGHAREYLGSQLDAGDLADLFGIFLWELADLLDAAKGLAYGDAIRNLSAGSKGMRRPSSISEAVEQASALVPRE